MLFGLVNSIAFFNWQIQSITLKIHYLKMPTKNSYCNENVHSFRMIEMRFCELLNWNVKYSLTQSFDFEWIGWNSVSWTKRQYYCAHYSFQYKNFIDVYVPMREHIWVSFHHQFLCVCVFCQNLLHRIVFCTMFVVWQQVYNVCCEK